MKKKITMLIMALMLVSAVLVNGKVAYADTTDNTSGLEITSAEVSKFPDFENVDPAALDRSLAQLSLSLSFENGQTLEINNWVSESKYVQDESGKYVTAYTGIYRASNYDYYLYLYDAEGNQVFFSADTVPVGEDYTLKFYRYGDLENAVYEQPIDIRMPETGKCEGDSAEFTPVDENVCEAGWYAIPAEMTGKEYAFSRYSVRDNSQTCSVSVWKYEDGLAVRENAGITYYNEQAFSHTFSETDNRYLVIKEIFSGVTLPAKVSWQEKKELASLELKAGSYEIWNEDYYNIDVTATYTDGTKDVCEGFYTEYSLPNGNGDGAEVNVDGMGLATPNGDTIHFGLKNSDGEWIDLFNTSCWKAGNYTGVIYAEADRSIASEAEFQVIDPETVVLDLKSSTRKGFTVSNGKAAYYSTGELDETTKILVENTSGGELKLKRYCRTAGADEAWERYHTNESFTDSFTGKLKAGYEYLIIVYADSKISGTIGAYSEGTTEADTVKVDTVKLSASKLVYTGSKRIPTLTITDINGTQLVAGTDYTYAIYNANGKKVTAPTTVGTYTIEITYLDKYQNNDSVKKTYYIVPKAVTNLKAQLVPTTGYNQVKISFTKSTGATGYYVYYKKSTTASYSTKYRKAITGNTVTIKGLAAGTKYNFKVVPYFGSNKVTSTKASTIDKTTLKKVIGVKVSRSGKKVKVSWTNIAGETGYQISRSTSKSGTANIKTYAGVNLKTKTITLSSAKKYYYKVRAYKTENGKKVYGPWSAVVYK